SRCARRETPAACRAEGERACRADSRGGVVAMMKFAVPAVIVAVIAFFFYVGLGLKPQPLPSPLIGKPMPEFSLPLLQDPERTLTNADLAGGVSLLNAWGAWCAECRIEHPLLVEIAKSGRVA